MKINKVLIICLVVFLSVGLIIFASDGAEKSKKKSLYKIDIIDLEGLLEGLAWLKDFHIDFVGLTESLKSLVVLEDFSIHLDGLEVLEDLDFDFDFDIEEPDLDFHLDFEIPDFFNCDEKPKSPKSKEDKKEKPARPSILLL